MLTGIIYKQSQKNLSQFERSLKQAKPLAVILIIWILATFSASAKGPIVLGSDLHGGLNARENWQSRSNGTASVSVDLGDPAKCGLDFSISNAVEDPGNNGHWRSRPFSLGPAADGARPITFSFAYKFPDQVEQGDNVRVHLRFFDATGKKFISEVIVLVGDDTGDSSMSNYRTHTLQNILAPPKAEMADVWINANSFAPWTSGTARFGDFSVTTQPRSLLFESAVIAIVLVGIFVLIRMLMRMKQNDSPVWVTIVSPMIMWTKPKLPILLGAVVLLALASIVAMKALPRYRENVAWSRITTVDVEHLRSAPPIASIRTAQFNSQLGGPWVHDGKKLLAGNKSMATILHNAYHVSESRIVALTPLPEDKYDVLVSLPDHQAEALQDAVKVKFGLVGNWELRNTDVLVLKVAKPNAKGLKSPAKTNAKGAWNSRVGQLKITNSRISTLAVALEQKLKLPVIDQTELTNRYDVNLKWPEDRLNPDPEALKRALLNQLGLELKPDIQETEVLVVKKTD